MTRALEPGLRHPIIQNEPDHLFGDAQALARPIEIGIEDAIEPFPGHSARILPSKPVVEKPLM